MTQAQANADVQQAKAMGFDGFALNVHTATDQWCLTSLSFLFGAAQGAGFKLFFSFDMSWFTDPSQFVSLLQTYHNHPAHFLKNNLPLVSKYFGPFTSGYLAHNSQAHTGVVQTRSAMVLPTLVGKPDTAICCQAWGSLLFLSPLSTTLVSPQVTSSILFLLSTVFSHGRQLGRTPHQAEPLSIPTRIKSISAPPEQQERRT